MKKKSLHTETLELIKNRPEHVSLRSIAEATGLGEHWVRSFAYERASNPGVNSVEKLNEYLRSLSGEAA